MHQSLESLIVLVTALLAGMPALTFVHELGHAIVAALLVGGRVTIVQGPAPARFRFSVWRLDFRLRGPVAPHRVMVGWALWGAHPGVRRHALATAAGPFTSGVLAAACLAGSIEAGGAIGLLLLLLAFASAFQMLSSGLPVRYGRWFGAFAGEASDGLRIRLLLQGRPEPAPRIEPRPAALV
jgi:hypothetical protein